MKRIIAFLLSLVLLLPLAACSSQESATKTATTDSVLGSVKPAVQESEEETEVKTAESGTTYNHVVQDPLTQADLDAIPIANSSMSTEELRDICVDFFNLSVSFTWIPDRDYNYVVESQNLKRVLEKGKLTGGLPYITTGHGNLYRALRSMNQETGVMNMQSYMSDPKLLGNACSGGASWGWARVVNSVKFQWTWGMTHANGFLKVGPYQYDLTLDSIGKGEGDYGTPEIVAENGEQVMYQSYAATHKADGVVNTGHVRMVVAEPHVEYNEDGTINGKKSYLVCTEQTCYNTKFDKFGGTQADGTTYFMAGAKEWKYSFDELYGSKYIPFTFAELIGTDPVEEAVVTIDFTGESASAAQLAECKVTGNYIISDVFFTILDAEGKEVFSYAKRCESFMKFNQTLSSAIPPKSTLTKYADGNHKVQISAQLGNGVISVAYTGTFVA